MAGSLNRVMLIGNLGADPELRFTPSGRAVANFNLATNEQWKDKEGQKQSSTEWHRVQIWGPRAETVAKYLHKGSSAYVEGKLQTRKWQDKEGNDRWTTEVVAFDVRFMDKKGEGGWQPGDDDGPPMDARGGPDDGAAVDPDDVPF